MTASETATLAHILRVQELLLDVANRLLRRALVHDASKLQEPEASVFEEFTAKLAGSTYGSPEYEQFRRDMKPALDHHYAHNRHHPEHFGLHICVQCGLDDREQPCTCGGPKKADLGRMTLLDLLEMLVDWKAAGERHRNGSMEQSLEKNRQRFHYGDELAGILERTALELWPWGHGDG